MTDEDKKQKVIELWALQMTTREIGMAVGMTKNAVCGLMKRMRDSGVDLPKRPGTGHSRGAKREKIAKVEKVTMLKEKAAKKPKELSPEVLIPVVPPPVPKPPEKTGRFRFIDLRPNSCRYVVSGKRAEEFLFCGEPKKRGAYCAEHAKLCYVPLQKGTGKATFKLTRLNNGR